MRLFTAAVLFLIFIIVSLLPLRFRFCYSKKGKDDLFNVTWQIIPNVWGITVEIPFFKISFGSILPWIEIITEIEGEKGTSIWEKRRSFPVNWQKLCFIVKKTLRILLNSKGFVKLSKWFLSKVSIRELKWSTEIGLSEPAKTGLLVGVAWSIKAALYGYLFHRTRRIISPPKITITPNFKRQVIIWNLDCIFDIPCGYIIIGSIKALYLLKKGVINFE
ncbi:MAG: DUF2953 domain-containing protein [Bacillota bacterium]